MSYRIQIGTVYVECELPQEAIGLAAHLQGMSAAPSPSSADASALVAIPASSEEPPSPIASADVDERADPDVVGTPGLLQPPPDGVTDENSPPSPKVSRLELERRLLNLLADANVPLHPRALAHAIFGKALATNESRVWGTLIRLCEAGRVQRKPGDTYALPRRTQPSDAEGPDEHQSQVPDLPDTTAVDAERTARTASVKARVSQRPSTAPVAPATAAAKPVVRPSGKSWWTETPREEMATTAERERERMSGSREAKSLSSVGYIGMGGV